MRMEDGSIFLQEVTEKIKERIAQTEETLAAGQKEIENMHDYYWENYTEMDQYGYEDFGSFPDRNQGPHRNLCSPLWLSPGS